MIWIEICYLSHDIPTTNYSFSFGSDNTMQMQVTFRCNLLWKNSVRLIRYPDVLCDFKLLDCIVVLSFFPSGRNATTQRSVIMVILNKQKLNKLWPNLNIDWLKLKQRIWCNFIDFLRVPLFENIWSAKNSCMRRKKLRVHLHVERD